MPNKETEKFEGHTPGPWRAGDVRHAGRTRLVDHDGPRGFVAEVYAPVRGNEWDEPTRDANARLMAAAPDLLRERDALRAAARTAVEFLEQRFGNVQGNDWSDEEAAHIADELETAAGGLVVTAAERERDEARRQRDALADALRMAEWSGPHVFAGASSGSTCPWCRQPKPPRNHLTSGHASDCAWVAALAKAGRHE